MKKLKREFSKIYDQCIDKIYRFIFIKVNSQETAEDLTSETFLRGWESFRSQSKNKKIENPSAFLYQIARNLVIDYYRQKGKKRTVPTEAVSIPDPVNLEEKTAFRSDLDIIKTAIANLREDYQNAIIWYYLNDLSITEIARVLNKSEGTVRVMIHRAVKEVKKNLPKDYL